MQAVVCINRGTLVRTLSSLVVLLLKLGCSDALYEPVEWDGGEYDFIVVGAGVGGCTVARRLSESGKYAVLLVEEGGLPHPDMEVPALSPNYVRDPNYAHTYPSVPQSNAGLANNGIIDYRFGRMLGGSSEINGMMFNRGSPHDFNHWAAITGDERWSYSNMLKYFIKLENYTGDYSSEQRGFNGPITVSKSKYPVLLDEWLSAGIELGYPVADSNGPQMPSFAPVDYTQRDGRRISSFTGYIEPMLQSGRHPLTTNPGSTRPTNLHILINSTVTKIIFERGHAIGVRILRNSTEGTSSLIFRARNEIILTAGVVGTPVLLLKSGVGPKSVLREAQIPLVAELPVGKHFQDHVITVQPMIINSSSGVISRDRELTPEALRQFVESGNGPYTSYSGNTAQAFIASTLSTSRLWPDVHLINNRYSSHLVDTSQVASELEQGEVVVTWLKMLTRPKSRGTISLDSSRRPLIDFQFYSHPDDLPTIVEGIKFAVKICEETETFRRIGCRLPQSPLPQCRHFPYKSDEYFQCYAKYVTGAGLHGAGTCRMGWGHTDREAVVDSQLRVIGLNGLRIADASIMPTIVNANPQGAVYAIGEKASEMILNFWDPVFHAYPNTLK